MLTTLLLITIIALGIILAVTGAGLIFLFGDVIILGLVIALIVKHRKKTK